MDVFDALKSCRSVRSYDPRPIPEDILRDVLEELRRSPSASNLQPWRFIVVRDPNVRRQIASAARSQFFIAEAPVVVVACGYPEQAQNFMGGLGNSLPIDVAVAFDRMMLAARAHGLATCWIGSYDEQEVRTILGIPNLVRVVALTPLGYPRNPGSMSPVDPEDRRSFDDVVVFDSYLDAHPTSPTTPPL